MPQTPLPPPDDVTTLVNFGGLQYSNPHQQVVHPRCVDGEIVWSIPCGAVAVDPTKTDVAEEYISVYSMDGDEGQPEEVKGQYTIYDTKPGDKRYSPLWRHNYGIVPRDYEPQRLRSEDDVLKSGFEVVRTDKITN